MSPGEEKKYWHEHEFVLELLKRLPSHVFWKDINGVYLGCNDVFARSLGLSSPEEIIGKTDYDLPVKEDDSNAYRIDDEEVIKTRKPKLNIEEEQTLADGRKVYLLTSKVPLQNKNNEIIGVLGIYSDITDLKKTQKQLTETKASEARFKAMSALGGMVAHELRTPFTALGMSAVAIQEVLPILIEGYEKSAVEGKVKPIRKERLDMLKKSVAHMERSIGYAQTTISTILSVFHLGNEDSKVSISPFPLKNVIEATISEYPFDVDEECLITIKCIDDVEVLGNEQMIVHVLHNLLKNALHVIRAEGKGEITIWNEVEDEQIALYVEDTAKGIASDQLPYIFDAFYTTKKETAASIGLGLYFCKTILQKMEGGISCESLPGRYTRFKIILPVA